MALFTDQFVSDVADLVAYEANLPDVSAAEGIDLGTKLRLAHTEIGAQLEAASRGPGNVYLANGSGWQSTGGEGNPARFALSQVVVTPPLKLLHTFQTLAIVYRDAYNRKLNDKYLPKWKEYKELANWARDLLFQTGIGLSARPIPRPDAAVIDWTPSTLGAGARFVRMTWIGTDGTEGVGSVEQAAQVPAENALRVTPPVSPEGVTGWNVYVGGSSGDISKQNGPALAVDSAWVEPESGLVAGEPPGEGQAPDLFKTVPRFLQRG